MSKLTKRLTKGIKNLENCAVIGTGFGMMSEISEIFNTVFVLSAPNQNIRGRNIVYRSNFEDLSVLPGIQVIFIDPDQLERILELRTVWTRYRSTLLIGSGEFIDKKYSKILTSHNYEIVELFKEYQVWTQKK